MNLYDVLLPESPYVFHDIDHGFCINTEDVFNLIGQLRLTGQWIPCSERLPNTNGIYIVTRRISDGFEYLNITDACYFDGSNTWHDDTRVNHERKYLADVLAWMPLPESYRAERRTDEGTD